MLGSLLGLSLNASIRGCLFLYPKTWGCVESATTDSQTHHKHSLFGEVLERLSPEEDKRIRRKLDRCLLPVMALSYAFQYLDKSALASTAILGLREDLKLTGDEYSWASGRQVYHGIHVSCTLDRRYQSRCRSPSRSLDTNAAAVFSLMWGAILMLTAACHNASGLLAVRFFLGIAESLIAPGLTIMISMFYKRSEQPLRHAAWFLGNTIAGALSGLLNYSIGHITSITPWKATFLILGGVTIAWACLSLFLLPDTPDSAWFLSKEDREKAIIRVQDNLTGIKNNEFIWEHCREAFIDPKTWILVALQICFNIPNGGITSLFLIVVCTVGARIWEGTRTYWIMLCFAIALLGAALVRELPDEMRWGRYVGTILVGGYSRCFPLIMSLLSSNVSRFTKKTTVNALTFIAYCAGNIIGPQLFFAKEAPKYNSGFVAMMVCLSSGFLLAFIFRLYLIWVNRTRDRECADAADSTDIDAPGLEVAMAMEDMTDMQIRKFRYVY
ncbi:hypothetical protein FGSG_08099 [Fusarium graminearum PH-1]|uniref:Chromosome 2, complete genome n=1 Tax=Gibberella zeae (strain ATCC MYA-4620 / CBS 123657 / FGSC 9075 / NRRL 31084 / PH-1) TaxID=229533 RepID=I1RV37_GIBZE|nr:hypothetical protein FGSG_08099 [Fusarium graminearum PH-1]ESU15296.1 hypothetical protein FGSG_08099 [Fusarium graminearum PH-1]CEF76358.1 unnamed protein product [Fusarium graminearum]|eukprot:XP_011320721.1 hypothetical protein FGSG_08099 [Fusarium graminearum PH-1]